MDKLVGKIQVGKFPMDKAKTDNKAIFALRGQTLDWRALSAPFRLADHDFGGRRGAIGAR